MNNSFSLEDLKAYKNTELRALEIVLDQELEHLKDENRRTIVLQKKQGIERVRAMVEANIEEAEERYKQAIEKANTGSEVIKERRKKFAKTMLEQDVVFNKTLLEMFIAENK